MIKECKVLLRNNEVIVVSYDGIDVQFTNTGIDKDAIFIKFENGFYSIVDEREYKEQLKSTEKKSKKVDNNESVSDIVEEK